MRLTPAHAGKTHDARFCKIMHKAHPRPRGENAASVSKLRSILGSPPPTRGKLIDKRRQLAYGGLTPAHAGKTQGNRCNGVRQRAHPRPRGENATHGQGQAAIQGSPPPTRGKPTYVRRDEPRLRLTPAHAGKTPQKPACQYRKRAHPRPRGENSGCALGLCHARGSPPPTRGKQIRG